MIKSLRFLFSPMSTKKISVLVKKWSAIHLCTLKLTDFYYACQVTVHRVPATASLHLPLSLVLILNLGQNNTVIQITIYKPIFKLSMKYSKRNSFYMIKVHKTIILNNCIFLLIEAPW